MEGFPHLQRSIERCGVLHETGNTHHPGLLGLSVELLQEVLQRVGQLHWPAVRLVSKQFEAALAPLINTVSVRQWPTDSSSNQYKISATSSLQQVQNLCAVVDTKSHQHQLLQLLTQLPGIQHLCLRGLQPLADLKPDVLGHLQQLSSKPSFYPALNAAAVKFALNNLVQLDLPDSSSSSMPLELSLPGITRMTLYAVDSMLHLATLAPSLQHLACFSLTVTPQSTSESHGGCQDSRSSPNNGSSVLYSCSVLSLNVVKSSSVATATACIAAAFPKLQQLKGIPQFQLLHPVLENHAPSQEHDAELTLQNLQAVLPCVLVQA